MKGSSCRGGNRISGKGVLMYKGVGGHFADFILFSFNITETKLFHFHRMFKDGGRGGRFERTPSGSATAV